MAAASHEPTRAHILLVEDSSVFREMQCLLLHQAGYAVSSHESPRAALEAARRGPFQLVVIDYELPEMNGQQFMHALRQLQPDIAVVFVSGALTLDLAIQLSRQGVAGIFNKPANPKTLLEKINETLARSAVRDTAARTAPQNSLRGSEASATARALPADQLAYAPRYLMGASDVFREFTHRVWKVRDFRAVLLLQGEPGSAFELIARDLAAISIFREGPTMICDVAQFDAPHLIEVLAPSLLSNDAGTLVVTGVERLTALQQSTLENLMTGRDVFLPFARRFRLVLAATDQLAQRVDDGGFDETLYYKISAVTLTVPHLREMRSDVLLNAERILAAHRLTDPAAPAGFTSDAAAWLEAQTWPGNYDQLARTIIQGATATTDPLIDVTAFAAFADETPIPFSQPSNAPTASAFGVEERAEILLPAPNARQPASAVTDSAPAPERSLTPARENDPATAGSLSFSGRSKSTPAAGLTAQSLFRPASRGYRFSERLTESLAAAANATPCGSLAN